MGSNKVAAELSDKEKNRRNKMMKMKKKQPQVTEKDEQENEVEERRNIPTVMKKKRRRAEEKYAVKNSSEGVGAAEQNQSATQGNSDGSKDAGKLEKSGKKRKSLIAAKGKKSSEKRKGPQTDISFVKDEEVEADDVYHISSGDDDCSKGMKEWLVEYQQSRPRLQILQEKIDEFITAHEAQLEQERKEREARAAEGGWTVVVHHKGRKKTTDSESGITVGSVAQAVVEDKMTKKKNKEVGLDFYRFQKREAQRNEIMMLQSKFEQDKKRIQQLRAARKFRPY